MPRSIWNTESGDSAKGFPSSVQRMNEKGTGIARVVVDQMAPTTASMRSSNPTVATIGFSSGLP